MPDKNRLLELALKGLEADRVRIEKEIAEVRGELGLGSAARAHRSQPRRAASAQTGKRRPMSAEAKQKISEAMKRRYAEMQKPAAAQQPKQSRGGGLTAAGRKKLSDMMRARWAARRKAGKKAA
jgi:hypothetical protein